MPRFCQGRRALLEYWNSALLRHHHPEAAGCSRSWLLPPITSHHWPAMLWGGDSDTEPKKCCQSHFSEGKEDSFSFFFCFSLTMFCWRNNFKGEKEKPHYCVRKMENNFLWVPRYSCAILPATTTLLVAAWVFSTGGFAAAVCTVPSITRPVPWLSPWLRLFVCKATERLSRLPISCTNSQQHQLCVCPFLRVTVWG